ncbi:hypothetical protein K1719_019807 [Acacia pycnantha]|nr:hypothetical protein K1719_019807 [Acacia pycnantha]
MKEENAEMEMKKEKNMQSETEPSQRFELQNMQSEKDPPLQCNFDRDLCCRICRVRKTLHFSAISTEICVAV